MGSVKFDNLIELLLSKYHHILDEREVKMLPTSSDVIDLIVSYYEDIISCMPGNVYWLDKHGTSVGCNQNVLTMMGLKTLSEFKGLSFEQMGVVGNWSPEATHSFKNDTLEVIHSGQPKLNIEEPPIPNLESGRMIYFLTSRVPLFDRQHNVIGIVGISIDITELKQTQIALKLAKEQAEAASLAKSEFVANMSHDVKTPLSGIIGMSEMLTYRLKDDNLELAKTLLTSSRQLLNFLENCLEISKLENKDVILITESFQLETVLNEMNELFQPIVKVKGLSLQFEYDQAIPSYLVGSRAGVYRILLNLIGNAVKFTHSGCVRVRASLQETSPLESKICLKIEDTGIGIPKDKQEIIFDRFTRLIPSYKGTYEGSGIGLYLVKKFINSMQGTISLQSEEGKGSCFSLLLPFKHPTAEHETPVFTRSSAGNISTPYPNTHSNLITKEKIRNQSDSNYDVFSILLVEDNVIAQHIQSSMFSSLNCNIDIADSGEKALQLFEPGKYNLILMDIGLPGIQGDEAAQLIRKKEKNSPYRVPIVALTAFVTDDIKKLYLSSDVQGVFNKPLSFEQAKELIEYYSGETLPTSKNLASS